MMASFQEQLTFCVLMLLLTFQTSKSTATNNNNDDGDSLLVRKTELVSQDHRGDTTQQHDQIKDDSRSDDGRKEPIMICGNQEVAHHKHRQKRYLINRLHDGRPNKWDIQRLTWAITEPSRQLSVHIQRRIVSESLQIWSEVSPLRFDMVDVRSNPDITFKFAKRKHGPDFDPVFDGRASENKANIYGHAWGPGMDRKGIAGDVHIDDDDDWSEEHKLKGVMVHELGHSIGLSHSEDPSAIMFPVYRDTTELSDDDVRGIQFLYGTSRRPITKRPTPKTTPRPRTRRPHVTQRPRTRRPYVTPRPRTRRPTVTQRPRTRRPYVTPRPRTRRPPVTQRPRTRRPYVTPKPRTRRPYVTPRSKRPNVTQRPPYVTRRPPYITPRPDYRTRRPPTVTRRPPTATRRPYVTQRPPYVTRRPPTVTKRPPTVTRRPPYVTRRPYITRRPGGRNKPYPTVAPPKRTSGNPITRRPRPTTTPRPRTHRPYVRTRRPGGGIDRPYATAVPETRIQVTFAPDSLCVSKKVNAVVEDPFSDVPGLYFAIVDDRVHHIMYDGTHLGSATLASAFPGVPNSPDVVFTVKETKSVFFIKDQQSWELKRSGLTEDSPKSLQHINFPEKPSYAISLFDVEGKQRLYLFGKQYWWSHYIDNPRTTQHYETRQFSRDLPSDVSFATTWSDNKLYVVSHDSYVIMDTARRVMTHEKPFEGKPVWLHPLCRSGVSPLASQLSLLATCLIALITSWIFIFNR